MLLDLSTIGWAFSGFWRLYLIGGCWWPVSGMTSVESHLMFEVLVYLGSFWHSQSGSYFVQSSNLMLSKFNWCCATTNLAYIVHFLHLGLKQHPICPMQTVTHSQGITCYPQIKMICQWCHQVLILSSLNVQFLGWTSLEVPWCWLRWSVSQMSYLPVNKGT